MRLVALDVRWIEPKHRFDVIMDAYGALVAGETLELIVDHDPMCMYYTLLATRGVGAFDFEYLDSGPETWRIHVRKLLGELPQYRGQGVIH